MFECIPNLKSLASDGSQSLPRYLDSSKRRQYQLSINKLSREIDQCPAESTRLVDLLYERAALFQKIGEFSDAMKDTSRALKLCET